MRQKEKNYSVITIKKPLNLRSNVINIIVTKIIILQNITTNRKKNKNRSNFHQNNYIIITIKKMTFRNTISMKNLEIKKIIKIIISEIRIA